MAIRLIIHKILKTNLKKKSVFVRLANTQPELAYREVEIVLRRDVDVAYLNNLSANELRALWNKGTEIDETAYADTKRSVDYAPFYKQVVDKAFNGLQKVDIGTAHAEILSLLDDYPDVKEQFLAINGNLAIDVSKDSPATRKREQVLWFLVLSLVNLLKEKA